MTTWVCVDCGQRYVDAVRCPRPECGSERRGEEGDVVAKISRHGGASVRVFDAPARVPPRTGRRRSTARVETFSTEREPPGTGEPMGHGAESTTDGTEYELTVEPTDAEVRAWAGAEGIEVAAKGKVPAKLVDRYKAANPPEPIRQE
ncbi:MAG: Lsr2 family DNA-binding protein [Natronosporangium sp.]